MVVPHELKWALASRLVEPRAETGPPLRPRVLLGDVGVESDWLPTTYRFWPRSECVWKNIKTEYSSDMSRVHVIREKTMYR